MTLHKLTAGDGYTYLTRQVAAHDADQRGFENLGEYYAEKGESPGVWMGSGCAHLPQFSGGEVSEAQMIALFGEGRHPDAERIEAELLAQGHGAPVVLAATRLGTPFKRYDEANEFRRRAAIAFSQYNTTRGARWNAPLPAEARASIRTDIARDMFTAEYGRAPADPRELSGFLARVSRQATTSVAGYDLTFSPVKSVSALWALAPREVAEQVEQAHHDAVSDVLSWLESNAAYTRLGRNGVQQVEVNGLIAAAFTHRDSRAGDPDLHTHVAISNKVQSVQDGRWLAVDGRPLHKMTVAASERYNTRVEALLTERLGIQFAERAGTDPGKRPVREVVGVDERITSLWSRRRAMIDNRRAELSAAFQSQHGRPPTTIEALALAQQANLETRQAKHAPRSQAEQRATWHAEARDVLGDDYAIRRMIRAMVGRRRPMSALQVTPEWIRLSAEQVVQTVQAGRATWQECHVRAEAERFTRAAGITVTDLDAAVDGIVATALSTALSVPLSAREPVTEPAALRRRNGESVYETAGTQLYTASTILEAETGLVALAQQHGARALTGEQVDVALLEATANGVTLNPGQAQLVRELACSGARLQLALAPAGTGKTTAMRILTRAWQTPHTSDAGPVHVLGLAPSAAAAAVLREEMGVHTDTLAKLLHALDEPRQDLPAWASRIGPGSLVIIDEAGMAGTLDLARVSEFVTARGGVIRLIGDDQQLASVAAGGVLRDIAATAGAVHLSQVMRFDDPAEGAATLALRAGDTAAIGFYLDHHRIHVGDQATVTDHAYTAWAGDRAHGRDAIMIAPTRELVAELNGRARADRLAATGPTGPAVQLADGSSASTGDVIITRHNDRRLPITTTDFVKNGDRWTVTAVHTDGSLQVWHHGTRRTITLPTAYVRAHVALGYATTVHGAQGITADTSHLVTTGDENRQLLYVGLTRGRTANHLYLPVIGDGDPHDVITRDALLPPTAVDLLTRIIARDGAQASATTTARELTDPAVRLRDAALRYHDALLTAAETHLGAPRLETLASVAEHVLPGLTSADAWPTLRSHLALLTLDGADPQNLLTEAIARRPMTSSEDPAAVLDWRLTATPTSGASGPLPWLPAIPDALTHNPEWADYLTQRHTLVRDLAADVATAAREWTPTTAPTWATAVRGRDADLTADLAVWRAATGVPDTDLAPAGTPRLLAAEARQQRRLTNRVHRVLGEPAAMAHRYRTVVDTIDPRIGRDPHWPHLADKLAIAHRAGLDIDSIVRAAASEGALPDEQPAAALWWRICRHLSPAALTGDAATVTTLRPAWTEQLHAVVGADAAARIVHDPAWPALVAAVTDAARDGWQPDQLLSTAYELLDSGHPAAEPLRPEELATALVWRIGMLTNPPDGASGHSIPHPTEPEPAVSGEPRLTDAAANEREWLDSLLTLEPPPAEPHPDPLIEDARADRGNLPPAVSDDRAPAVARARLIELTQQAQEFFAHHLTTSWAADYLADRLGTAQLPTAIQRYQPGYAPAGWTTLIHHLRSLGADDHELTAAGLATITRRGQLIDRFRDRLVFPIWHQDEIHGFIARRNPTSDDTGGPKYLNTSENSLFHKGHQLYGMHEARDLLDTGATPVLVEGPLDAIAITLSGRGEYVGVAPLGTAFTDRQADLLRPAFGSRGPGIIVATDNDAAGQRAADRAYWQLTARNADPKRLALPTGHDPADALKAHGPRALAEALARSDSLAAHLIDLSIDKHAGRLDTAEGTVHAIRAAAQIAGAAPPTSWIALSARIEQRLTTVVDGLVLREIIDAGDAWTEAPMKHAAEHARRKAHAEQRPEQRWAQLGRSIRPDLITGRDWTSLARALDRMADDGHDVAALIRHAAREQLPYQQPARELQHRLIAYGITSAMAQPPPRATTPPERRPMHTEPTESPRTQRTTQPRRSPGPAR